MNMTKKTIATITLVLMLTVSAMVVALPVVNAADYNTYAFLGVNPNPVGVGQTLVIVMWLNNPPPRNLVLGAAQFPWEGFEIEVTKPDGTTQTLGPYKSGPTGGQWIEYTPDQVGTYTFQFSFPGQLFEEGLYPGQFGPPIYFLEDYYGPSTSPIVPVTVQQEPIPPYPDTPLPTGYWDRPIEAENKEWGSISGNWLASGFGSFAYGTYNASGNFNPYTKAPNTAHIVWTKPIMFGGLMGGEFGHKSYYQGMTYEPKLTPPIIMNGRLYYNTPTEPLDVFYCVDLRTGEEIWYQDTTVTSPTATTVLQTQRYGFITTGQILNFESPNQYGGIPYLWSIIGTTWRMYDAWTGNWILDMENVTMPAGALNTNPWIVFDKKGNLLVYLLDGTNNWLAMWNSTKAIGSMLGAFWRPFSGTYDWKNGVEWNVTIPDVPGVQNIAKVTPDILLANTGSIIGYTAQVTDVAYDAKTGQQLWAQNRTFIPGTTSYGQDGPMLDGVYTQYIKEELSWYGYDANTGNKLWGPTEPYTLAYGMYPGSANIAYGNLYAQAYDGMVHAYDLETGAHMWDYWTGSSGYETAYGHWPLGGFQAIADGKVYATTGEHSPSNPNWRGGKIHCIDAETGDGIWSILGWFMVPAIADGYLVSLNGYDMQIYCFGKGQTATTVSAPQTAAPKGSSVIISGTVTDQSPGAEGTAAISDGDMTAWMEYMYMQKPMPMDASGVEVTLDAIDPNGEWIHIDRVTTDISGFYSYKWTPENEGKYTIVATFEGSESYWASYAETAVGVDPAPEPYPDYPEAPTYTTTDLAIIAAVIIAIIIGAVSIYLLRKQRK